MSNDLPTADAVMRSALETKTRSLMTRLTADQEKAFHRFYPRGIDNMAIAGLKDAYALVCRTIQHNGDVDERVS